MAEIFSPQQCDEATRIFDDSFYLVGVVATALSDIAPENRPSQNESSFPTIIFEGLC